MRSKGERTFVYLYIYIYIYRDSASVESTRGASLTLAPTSRMLEHYVASVSEVADSTEARSQSLNPPYLLSTATQTR